MYPEKLENIFKGKGLKDRNGTRCVKERERKRERMSRYPFQFGLHLSSLAVINTFHFEGWWGWAEGRGK